MQIEENAPLAPLTTLHIGGAARALVHITSVADIPRALMLPLAGEYVSEVRQRRVYVLGGGSNTLVPDEGFAGIVLKIEITGIEWVVHGAPGVDGASEQLPLVIAGAGESWDALVARAVERGLWGLENLSGIPGTVGGAVWGNIGAYGAAVSQTLAWVEAYDRTTGDVLRFAGAMCAFGYRDSFFKQRAPRYIITRAAFHLSKTPQPNLSYKDLHDVFGDTPPTVAMIRDAVLAIRAKKFPNLAVEGSAGSFFKNPIVPKEQADALVAKYPEMPVFALPETTGVKIPLAWLMDHVLRLRGFAVGKVRLFEEQPLVLVAAPGASSAEVDELAEEVRTKVFDTFGIQLEREVQEMK